MFRMVPSTDDTPAASAVPFRLVRSSKLKTMSSTMYIPISTMKLIR